MTRRRMRVLLVPRGPLSRKEVRDRDRAVRKHPDLHTPGHAIRAGILLNA